MSLSTRLASTVTLAALALPAAAPAETFHANPATLGLVADGIPAPCFSPGAARDVTFQVSGLRNKVTSVAVTFDFDVHPAVGDLDVILLGPGGTPAHTLLSRTGAITSTSPTCWGAAANVEGPYTFSDAPGAGNWWAVAQATVQTAAIPSGTYRTSTQGGDATGGLTTSMLPAFAGLASPNGTWTLRFTDHTAGEVGSVQAASLTITARDTIRPQTTFTRIRTPGRRATFRFRSSEAGSTFFCKHGATPFRRCSSPKTLTGLALGRHTFQVRARDAAGNVDATPAKFSWRVMS